MAKGDIGSMTATAAAPATGGLSLAIPALIGGDKPSMTDPTSGKALLGPQGPAGFNYNGSQETFGDKLGAFGQNLQGAGQSYLDNEMKKLYTPPAQIGLIGQQNQREQIQPNAYDFSNPYSSYNSAPNMLLRYMMNNQGGQ